MREARRLGVAPAEAAQLGLRCRRLMDSARLLHLRGHGFDVALVEHVDFRVTADNVMLSAVLPATVTAAWAPLVAPPVAPLRAAAPTAPMAAPTLGRPA